MKKKKPVEDKPLKKVKKKRLIEPKYKQQLTYWETYSDNLKEIK